MPDLVRWREQNPVDMPVDAGVMVLASAGMARRLASSVPDIAIPDELVRRVEADPDAGVDAACEQVLALRETGAFAGVHMVPVSRYRQVGARLERDLARSDLQVGDVRRQHPATASGVGLAWR